MEVTRQKFYRALVEFFEMEMRNDPDRAPLGEKSIIPHHTIKKIRNELAVLVNNMWKTTEGNEKIHIGNFLSHFNIKIK